MSPALQMTSRKVRSGKYIGRNAFAAAANEPALVCREALLGQPYHYWLGASGRRYLHTIFSLVDCPALAQTNILLVRRDADGTRRPLYVGQVGEDACSLNLARLRRLGARLGANEVHLHLLADGPAERDRVAADLEARQLGPARPRRIFRAANDGATPSPQG